jgi:DNA-binding LytR/AlgR family response regulator
LSIAPPCDKIKEPHNLSKGGKDLETPLKVAVCEDLDEDAGLLIACISQSGIPARSEVFSSGEALLENFSAGRYDLVFLDIYIDGIQQGIDVAGKIRSADSRATLAFTTSSKEHALESYRLKACAYLEKPLRPEDVREVLEQAVIKRKISPSVKLLMEGVYREIPLNVILYFEQRNHAVQVNTLTEALRTSQTVKLKDIEPMLPDTFLRCHHSYIANLCYVAGLDRKLRLFIMKNGDKVYIRRQDMKKAADAYEAYLFAAARGDEV